MKRAAVIDIGSRSVKCFVGEMRADGRVGTVLDESKVTALGASVFRTGLMDEDAIRRTARTVASFAGKARTLGADAIAAAGTMALRSAKNSADLTDLVRELTGLTVRTLSGQEEARLSYLSAVSGLPGDGDTLVFDLGGGSTELIRGRARDIRSRMSLDLGVNRITERFFEDEPVDPSRVTAALQLIRSELAHVPGLQGADRLIGIGGAATVMSAVRMKLDPYDPLRVHGSLLTAREAESQIMLYAQSTLDERRAMPGMQKGRAEVILAGACIVRAILEATRFDHLTVSDRGLRHGLAQEMLEG